MATSFSEPGNATNKLVSIIVPVLNEEEAIQYFFDTIDPILTSVRQTHARIGFEIVFVDDGSRDRTIASIAAQNRSPATVRVVKFSRNFGKDAALAAGLAQCRGDAAIPMDVDLQDPPELLPEMIDAWLDGYKIVNAVREDRSSDTWMKRVTAKIFYAIFDRLANQPIHANVGDFRLIDRSAIDILNKMPERIRFMKSLFSWVGFEVKSIPYARPSRVAGQTKWKFWTLWNFALDGITGTTTLPLRMWTYIGLLVAGCALIYSLIIVFKTLLYGVDVPGYASLMAVTLTLGAFNLISIGIIGEYVGRISVEVRQRPLYVIDDVLEMSSTAAKSVEGAPAKEPIGERENSPA